MKAGTGPPFLTLCIGIDTLEWETELIPLGECRGPMTSEAVQHLRESHPEATDVCFAFVWDNDHYTIGMKPDDWEYPFVEHLPAELTAYGFSLLAVVALVRLETGMYLKEPQ